MKKLINTILLALFITSSAFAKTTLKPLNPNQPPTDSILKEIEHNHETPTNINQKLQDIEELVKYLALIQVQEKESNHKQSPIKKSSIKNNTKIAKAISLAKAGFWNLVGVGKFTLDKADKIISKKFFIAACLVLGPAALAYAKLKPEAVPNITEAVSEKIVTGGMEMGEHFIDGAIKSTINNPKSIAKILGGSVAVGTAVKVGEEITKNSAPIIAKIPGAVLSSFIWGGKFVFNYAAFLARKIGHRQQLQ